MDTVLIPAYEPDAELIGLTKQLRAAGFAVVVVDDGSGSGPSRGVREKEEN